MVQEDTTENLIKRCSHGEVDLALLALPIVAKNVELEPLFDEELLLVVPVGHPLAAAKSVGIESVDGYPFVMLNEAHCLSDNIASFCRRKSVQPVTVERTSQLATGAGAGDAEPWCVDRAGNGAEDRHQRPADLSLLPW